MSHDKALNKSTVTLSLTLSVTYRAFHSAGSWVVGRSGSDGSSRGDRDVLSQWRRS